MTRQLQDIEQMTELVEKFCISPVQICIELTNTCQIQTTIGPLEFQIDKICLDYAWMEVVISAQDINETVGCIDKAAC
jgi:hypothetical protein